MACPDVRQMPLPKNPNPRPDTPRKKPAASQSDKIPRGEQRRSENSTRTTSEMSSTKATGKNGSTSSLAQTTTSSNEVAGAHLLIHPLKQLKQYVDLYLAFDDGFKGGKAFYRTGLYWPSRSTF